jgi:hypothetical protein
MASSENNTHIDCSNLWNAGKSLNAVTFEITKEVSIWGRRHENYLNWPEKLRIDVIMDSWLDAWKFYVVCYHVIILRNILIRNT